jgi:hypothetical protein
MPHHPTASQLPHAALTEWALNLESEGLVRLGTYHGKKGLVTLLPRIVGEDAGMVTVYNTPGRVYLQFWRGVIERRAPASLSAIERAAAPIKVSQGSTTWEVSDELLDALTEAYREAAGLHLG